LGRFEFLPFSTEPWRLAIVRRHEPAETSDYRDFRDCLRWEFGFSCAFCLLHESDLSSNGTEGWGLMWIEHAELQSERPDLANQYENCFYSCRFCNQARGARPSINKQLHQLLTPCAYPWRDLFDLVADEIQVRGKRPDASYTLEAYDLNEPRKVRMRRKRRTTLRERIDVVTESRPLHDRLLARARDTGDPTLVEDALEAWKHFHRAWRDLETFVAIPEDVNDHCACGHQRHHSLPEVLAEQTIKVENSIFSWGSG
jgi:hypothetical protein